MRILYKDPADGTLAVCEITSTTYYPDEEVLQLEGDMDLGVRVDQATAQKLVRSLYLEGKVDVTGYESCSVELEFDEDEFDEEEFDEDFEDSLDLLFSEDEEGDFGLPHRIAFPKKKK